MIGDLIQSWCDMRVRFWAPPCLASMCFTSPLYIFSSLSLSLRALISCSPMHVMYVLVRMLLCRTCRMVVVLHHWSYILVSRI